MSEPISLDEGNKDFSALESKGKELRTQIIDNPNLENDTVLNEIANWIPELQEKGHQKPQAVMLATRAAVGYSMEKRQIMDANHLIKDMGETTAKRPLADKASVSGTIALLKLVEEQVTQNFQKPEDVLVCRHDVIIASELAEKIYDDEDNEMVIIGYRNASLKTNLGQTKEGFGHRILQIRNRATSDGPIIDITNQVVTNNLGEYKNYWQDGKHWQPGTGSLTSGEWYAISMETGMETSVETLKVPQIVN